VWSRAVAGAIIRGAVGMLRLLVLVLALLVPPVSLAMANIDPPDPTWAGGYWDDDDFDFAVDAVFNFVAVVPPSPAAAAGPCWIAIGRVDALEVDGGPLHVLSADAPRGPPASSPV
jgi:hypothetical protein